MRLWKIVLMFVFLGISALMLSCGQDDETDGGGGDDGAGGGGTEVTYNYVGTQTAGDFWQLYSDDDSDTGDITVINETTGYSYSGTASPSAEPGFTLLTVTDSDDPDFSGEFTGYMVKVPGTMMVVAPGPFEVFDHGDGVEVFEVFGSASPPIVAIQKGNCPAEGGTFNLIMMPPEEWDSRDDPAYGQAVLTVIGDNTYDIGLTMYRLDETELLSGTVSGATCENGVLTGDLDTGDELVEVKVSFTPSGLIFVDLPPGYGALAGVEESDVDVDSADFFSGRVFTGMYFNSNYGYESGDSHPETDPTYMETIAPATVRGYQYTSDLETAGNKGDPFDMSLEDMTQPFPGLIRTEMTDADGTHDFVLALRKIDGRYFFFSISDNWPSMHGYNTLMIEQN
ncbi:MAG: hypothetical protein JRD68_07755 [Deltaproteobacteria bacterium]|nr:hypothetical protein [Deltaproteobacteria bacterium]